MSDVGENTIFERYACKMVRGVIVLMRGVHIGTMYDLLGNVDLTKCNSIVFTKADSNFVPHLVNQTMLWH